MSDHENELAQTSLQLLEELEASLQGGQSALLALDVAAMEHSTAEQCRLSQSLKILLGPEITVSQDKGEGRQGLLAWPKCVPELDVALRAAKSRVLHLTQVQAALLSRAQRFLAVLHNLTAGPGAPYGPLLSQMSEIAATAGSTEVNTKNPCRV